ncbi:conserved hypothetical protein [Methanosarcina thermophila]|uniref:Uncharacterized protein n=1 Tax=Methanosarcina thermophila TaxID=2210 RepID=A0A3G9CTF7_METTE|nr:conserved hypothetical protein [Methanosarcina thermophila]
MKHSSIFTLYFRISWLKSDLRGIETSDETPARIRTEVSRLKSDLRGIETTLTDTKFVRLAQLKSDLRGIET